MWSLGADIGKTGDPTAMAAVERRQDNLLDVRHLERLPLGLPYPAIVGQIGETARTIPRPCRLIADATGVGRPVLDLLDGAGLRPVGVLITGIGVTQCAPDGLWHVSKRDLVRPVLTALEGGRLRIAGSLELAPALTRELLAFRAVIGRRGHTKFEGVGEHDDLVIALALPVWWLDVGMGLAGAMAAHSET